MGVEAHDLWRDNLSLSLNLSLWIRDDRQPLLSRAYRINVKFILSLPKGSEEG